MHPQRQRTKTNMVNLPVPLVRKLVQQSESFLAIYDELEDYSMSKDQKLLKQLRDARKQHLRGETVPLAAL
ncbi:hypothetical protein HY629_00790 [Candidatus Uhrbacteria bacterium]|nr:hypothetical protein [Candidatus Uhrbacteria bacterium]